MSRLWSFDLDGVLAEPPCGWNPAINRDVGLQPAADPVLPPPRTEDAIDRLLSATWYRIRYVLRPPRRDALEAVRLAAEQGSVIVLTGRHERGRRQTQGWLEQHGFTAWIDALIMNASNLKSARYKETYLRGQHAQGQHVALHVDDDAATAALLARNRIPSGLVAWPRNRGLTYPAGVTRCDDMREVCNLIERLASDD